MNKIDVLIEALKTAKTRPEQYEIIQFIKTMNSDDMSLEGLKRLDEAFKTYLPKEYEDFQPMFQGLIQIIEKAQAQEQEKGDPK